MSNLKSQLDSEMGKELKGFLIQECEEINNIENVKECSSAAAQALEFKATKKAAKILQDILNKIITLENPSRKVGEKTNYV